MADNRTQFGALGMNLDSSKIAISQGEVTYCLNALLTEKGFIQNEPANYLCTTFTTGYVPIGHVNLEDSNETVYFLVDVANSHSEIGIVDQFCNYTVLVNDDCLGFSIEHQIRAVYRPNGECGRNVYWTDDFNVPRWLDIDNIDSPFDCDTIRVFQFTGYPCIEVENLSYDNGALMSGSYSFTIQYADINGNPKSSPFFYTNPYPIVRDKIGSTIAGSAPNTPTAKAINVLFSSINTDHDYFNLLVIKKIDGIITAEKVITLPTALTTNYLYTGNEESIDITMDEAIQEPITYLQSKEVIQTNRRLIWLNMAARSEFNFQPYANAIQVKWVTKKAEYVTGFSDYRNPYYTVYDKTLLRDEIYALGIRLIYADGTKSCVYHIPGRKKNLMADGVTYLTGVTDQYGNAFNGGSHHTWDTDIPTGTADDNYTTETERWKIYNTATVEGVATCDGVSMGGNYGQMSYWEEALTYPADATIWGANAGQPIRHHKMPDCSITNIFAADAGAYLDDPTPKLLGLRFANIDVSAVPDCIGYELVIGDRTNHKSIIDKGLLFNNMLDTSLSYYYTNWPFNDPANHTNDGASDAVVKDTYTGYSPNALFKNISIGSVSELKIESEFHGVAKNIHAASSYESGTNAENGLTFTNISPVTAYGEYNLFTTAQYGHVRRNVTGIQYLVNNLLQITDFGTFNNIYRESATVFKVGSNINFCTTTDTSKDLLGDVVGVSEDIASYYYSIKSPSTSIWPNIIDIPYLNSGYCAWSSADTSVDCYFPGDSFITKFAFHKRITDIYAKESMDRVTTEYDEDDLSDDTIVTAVPIFFVESDINTEYRYNGNTVKEYYYPSLNHAAVTTSEWLTLGIGGWIDTDNYYLYNNDYSALNNYKFVCTATAENLVDCTEDFPTRAVYSEQQNVKEIFDNYLSYKANSFYDYPLEDGEVWQAFASGDTLFVRTLTNIYQHKLNFQQLETDVNNIAVGTGLLFAIPPVQMTKVDNGYAGTTNQWVLNLTPFGYFFCDSERGTVFQFEKGLDEISQNKTFRYFRDNLSTTLDKQVDEAYGDGTFANKDNPANPNGIGLLSAWDNDNKRWILTKRDYEVIDPDVLDDTLFYEEGAFHIVVDDEDVPVPLTDTTYFCNRSFTISYSPITKHWVSFHSYLPTYFNTKKDNFQSVDGDNLLFSHDSQCVYQSFYDVTKPFIIELTSTLDSVENFTSPALIWTQEQETCTNNVDTDLTDFTFNKSYVYNDYQHSGLLNLSLLDDLDLSSILSLPIDGTIDRTIQYSNKEGTYSFSDFEDISSYQDKQIKLNTSSCSNEDYITAYPIDKVPDIAKIDFAKNWYERTRFRSNWISYRLIQDARTDVKLVTNFFITDPKSSVR